VVDKRLAGIVMSRKPRSTKLLETLNRARIRIRKILTTRHKLLTHHQLVAKFKRKRLQLTTKLCKVELRIRKFRFMTVWLDPLTHNCMEKAMPTYPTAWSRFSKSLEVQQLASCQTKSDLRTLCPLKCSAVVHSEKSILCEK